MSALKVQNVYTRPASWDCPFRPFPLLFPFLPPTQEGFSGICFLSANPEGSTLSLDPSLSCLELVTLRWPNSTCLLILFKIWLSVNHYYHNLLHEMVMRFAFLTLNTQSMKHKVSDKKLICHVSFTIRLELGDNVVAKHTKERGVSHWPTLSFPVLLFSHEWLIWLYLLFQKTSLPSTINQCHLAKLTFINNTWKSSLSLYTNFYLSVPVMLNFQSLQHFHWFKTINKTMIK